jgi:hypothetical protein
MCIRLLARVLKEGVQFRYNDTSTVKGGGGGGSRKRSSGKPLKFTLLHVWFSICSKLVWNFSNTLGFVSLCCYASLLNYDIFIQPGTPSTWSNCLMYDDNENWSYVVSEKLIILREIIENNFPFPPEFGRPKASIFRSRGVPGRLDALLAKSLMCITYFISP